MQKENKKAVIHQASSPRHVVGDLPLARRYQTQGVFSYLTNNTQKRDSRQKHSGMTTLFSGRAFTLIELLVVVLIIGILSAIALPRYQVAVEKTYAAQVLLVLQNIVKAEDVYYLSEGKFTNNYDILDIDIPGTLNAQNRYVFSNGAFVEKPGLNGMVHGATGRGLQLYCTAANYTPTTDYQPSTCYCKAQQKVALWQNVCKSLGGKVIGSGGCDATGDAADTTIRACTNYELP